MCPLWIRVSVIVSIVGVASGCSSSGGSGGGADGSGAATLDCAWLAGENCWKTTATSASSCLPPTAETGTFSADKSTCTYSSGAVVTFIQPLVFPITADATWNFTIDDGGQACLHYEHAQEFTLTVGDQMVTETTAGAFGMQIKCPDGATYSNSDALALLDCGGDGGLLTDHGLPGNTVFSTSTSVGFGLVGTSSTSSSELQLFDCAMPESGP